ncbi:MULTISPECIES: TlpA disulfide reductase family protein [unclassified Pedobacter]|uniref:TlpA family protein disulfide reductase n=1 Tax=unclassified Pedobacter TaxID=2628915 RepID=UPI001D532598|nr:MULTISPECIES: TlpA disulfide reductase family protein [unclassified Pedobacter]CAH0296223.1 Thiol-disulfide oxidoreductase ResA [Pedobacter sp. Bi36]CAH0306966.1 Thiol-disulfide oxidoreductase ResA [Pedobacter sp. Bi126]
MKNLAHLLTLIFFFYLIPANAKPIVPKNLHGFWSYKATKVGNWNGTLINDNYVEYNYRMYKVDSVKNTDGITKIWLNTKNKDVLTLEIKAPADGKALLKFNRWEKEISCTWNASDPDIKVYSKDEIPSYYFGKWVSAHSNFYITAKHKMLYQNKEWEIVWAGNYMDKEDRFLLKEKDSCRMVYVHKLVKALKVNSLEGLKIYAPIAKNPLVYQFLGNWINNETNAWQYGFFEDFAIYNQKVYPYKSIEKNGKSLKITLLQDGKEKSIQFTAKNDSIAQLVDEQGASNVYLLKKEFKANRTKDATAFKDSHFARVDTAVITGYLRNPTSNKPFSVGFTDHLKDDQVNYYGDLDSNGFFTVKIPLLNTTQVFLDWERNGVIDVIEPGEHYFYFEDFNTQVRSTMGDNASFHNELLNYKYYSPYSEIKQSDYDAKRKADLLTFLTISKKEYDNGTAYLNGHLRKYPNASNRFRYFVSEGYKYELAGNLMQKRFALKGKEKFPEPFMKYVDDSLYKNLPPKPFTLIRDFSLFSRDYYAYLRKEKEVSVDWDDVVLEMINSGQMSLSAKEIEAVLIQIKLNKIAPEDSLKIKQFLKIFTADKRELAESTRKVYREQIMSNAGKKLHIKSLDADVKIANSISNEDLREGIIARNFHQYFENNHIAMPDTSFKYFMANLKSDYYRNEINKLQLAYQNMSKVDVDYKESLKRTDHLKDAKNADSLFAELIKPYKGKVIYVDFWGTWCAPCKGEMPFVKPVKEALKGKDVVFMYFANNSPEEGWKNIIKEYELSSENAVHYRLPETQQNMIETRFSINSFPTYILIDKEGNVNTMKAPRPSDKEQLVAAVNTLLTK